MRHSRTKYHIIDDMRSFVDAPPLGIPVGTPMRAPTTTRRTPLQPQAPPIPRVRALPHVRDLPAPRQDAPRRLYTEPLVRFRPLPPPSPPWTPYGRRRPKLVRIYSSSCCRPRQPSSTPVVRARARQELRLAHPRTVIAWARAPRGCSTSHSSQRPPSRPFLDDALSQRPLDPRHAVVPSAHPLACSTERTRYASSCSRPASPRPAFDQQNWSSLRALSCGQLDASLRTDKWCGQLDASLRTNKWGSCRETLTST